ncbi:MAG: iron-containing redox enzyme family protein [Bacteroidetes bacterium]|nr:iron-containing redox enzyme family protein [Bacteroidota bacterium]MBS1975423.1 iron-containing redox enzyme family protein [Bacteroidota bacterium]
MNNSFKQTLDRHNLLQHPFYVAWNEGKLTREQLALYAGEYGSFIQLISKGWAKAGENKIAQEEEAHYKLWQKFAGSIGAENTHASLLSVKALLNSMEQHYGSYAGALGALYAFEAQQPATASSKLDGLRKHYSSWGADETYFQIHSTDFAEPALLEQKMSALSETERAVALEACVSTAKALWEALTGIMEAQKN